MGENGIELRLHMPRLRTAFLLIVALAVVALPSARAQTADLARRLPADTLLYVYWRGSASITANNQDALVSLWNDPGFEPARQLILKNFLNAAAQNPQLGKIPSADIEQLLADPFIFGLRLTSQGKSAGAAAGAKAVGFLVMRPSGKAGRELRSALESGAKGKTDFRFTRSGLLLASSDPATLGELARQYGPSGTAGGQSLSTLKAFQEARAEIAGRPSLEFFLRVPKTSSLAPRKTPSFNTEAFLESLHLERVHVLCGSLDLDSPTALVHFAILGDTSPGSLFDFFGANAPSFSTLAVAPAGASVAVYRFDLGAVLSLLTNAFSSALAPQDAARLEIISVLLSSTVVPALGGEYAAIWPRLTGDNDNLLFALTVKSQAAKTLLTTTLAPFVKPAGQEGNIEYFRPVENSSGAKKGNAPGGPAGATVPKSALLALTPKLAIMGQDDSLVRSRARAVVAATPSPGLAGSSRFRAARAGLPAQLSGLGYFNLQNFDWTKWLDQMAANMAEREKNPQAAQNASELEKWARSGGGAALARHLHLVVAGAWKDDQGMHWLGKIH